MITIVTTLHQKTEAVRLGKGLLEKRLIACYNLWAIESVYWWKGELLEEPETMMLLKTQAKHFDEIVAYIKQESGYEVPDIYSLKPDQTILSYENWVKEETSH